MVRIVSTAALGHDQLYQNGGYGWAHDPDWVAAKLKRLSEKRKRSDHKRRAAKRAKRQKGA